MALIRDMKMTTTYVAVLAAVVLVVISAALGAEVAAPPLYGLGEDSLTEGV